jgi:hypothetical protein
MQVGVSGVGSGSGLGNGVRKARVPMCHVEALTMDALETGVKFEEGETVLNALKKTHAWLKRARTAMSRHTGVTLAVFKYLTRDLMHSCVCVWECNGIVGVSPPRNLIRDAESVPVDLWSHVREIRRMLGRARVRRVCFWPQPASFVTCAGELRRRCGWKPCEKCSPRRHKLGHAVAWAPLKASALTPRNQRWMMWRNCLKTRSCAGYPLVLMRSACHVC